MSATEHLRRQHAEIGNIVHRLRAAADASGLAQDATAARGVLGELAAKLMMHLSMEDDALYPVLMADADENVSGRARAFADAMLPLTELFAAYRSRWRQPEAIENNVGEFVEATRELLAALTDRIDREESELYPMADDHLQRR